MVKGKKKYWQIYYLHVFYRINYRRKWSTEAIPYAVLLEDQQVYEYELGYLAVISSKLDYI